MRFEGNAKEKELLTGWPLFDDRLGGLPYGDCFVTIIGKQNQGKTSLIANLGHRLVDNNKNTSVMIHSIDDSLEWFIPRILGSKYQVPSKWFRKAGLYMVEQSAGFREKWDDARKWLRENVEKENLILADAVSLPGTVSAFESWIRAIRNRYPDRHLICCGDNFHLFDIPGLEEGERKVRLKSQYFKNIANKYHITVIMSVELPKDALRAGYRPRAADIKGSSGMAFDANIAVGIYNDFKDFGQKAKIFWNDPTAYEDMYIQADGVQKQGKMKPVVELIFDKVKIDSGFSGSIFYKLNPESGEYIEANIAEQASWGASASTMSNPPPAQI
jgi:GTPase SAR1 family protein